MASVSFPEKNLNPLERELRPRLSLFISIMESCLKDLFKFLLFVSMARHRRGDKTVYPGDEDRRVLLVERASIGFCCDSKTLSRSTHNSFLILHLSLLWVLTPPLELCVRRGIKLIPKVVTESEAPPRNSDISVEDERQSKSCFSPQTSSLCPLWPSQTTGIL